MNSDIVRTVTVNGKKIRLPRSYYMDQKTVEYLLRKFFESDTWRIYSESGGIYLTAAAIEDSADPTKQGLSVHLCRPHETTDIYNIVIEPDTLEYVIKLKESRKGGNIFPGEESEDRDA